MPDRVHPAEGKPVVLLVGIYDRNTVSLAGHLLRACAEAHPVGREFEIQTAEFSIFRDPPEAIAREIARRRPHIVGFSAYVWNLNEILAVAPHLRATVILGGPQVTGIEGAILAENPSVDIIATGEGEETFVELLEAFAGLRPLESVDGISTRGFQTAPRAVLADLNRRPSPYARLLAENPHITWISYESARGCPMACGYCTWAYAKKMRYLDTGRVLADLALILDQKNIANIYFCDSSLLINRSRAKKILRFLVDRRCDKEIRFEFDAQHLDDELIALLAGLPRSEFNFGLQTITAPALAAAGRRFDRRRFEDRYAQLVKRFPQTHITVDLIYGLPGDTLEGFMASLDYAMALPQVRRILTNPLIALPGSLFFREQALYGIEIADTRSYLVRRSNTFSEQDMQAARRISFYVSLVYLNAKLPSAFRTEARRRGMRTVDFIFDFFERLPFLKAIEAPDMVPSALDGFQRRNRGMAAAIGWMDDIVAELNSFAATPVVDYREAFTEHYHKLKSYLAA